MKNKSMRTLSVFLILVIAVAFTACGPKTPVDVYNKAGQKLNESDSFSMTLNIDMNMKILGQTKGITSEADIKQINSDRDPELEMKMATNAMGTSFDTNAYYKDGYYFLETDGQKIKMMMGVNDAMTQMNSGSVSVANDAVKESSMEDMDGGKEIKMTLDGQQMMDAASGLLGDMSQYGSTSDIQVGDFEVTAFVDSDGNLKSTKMEFTMDMTVQGKETSVDVIVDFDVDQIGGVTIEFPSDLDSYKESSGTGMQSI